MENIDFVLGVVLVCIEFGLKEVVVVVVVVVAGIEEKVYIA